MGALVWWSCGFAFAYGGADDDGKSGFIGGDRFFFGMDFEPVDDYKNQFPNWWF